MKMFGMANKRASNVKKVCVSERERKHGFQKSDSTTFDSWPF